MTKAGEAPDRNEGQDQQSPIGVLGTGRAQSESWRAVSTVKTRLTLLTFDTGFFTVTPRWSK